MEEGNLRNSLYNHEKTPPPNVWPGIQRELKKRRRKRFYMRLMIAGGLLMVLASVGVGFSEWAMDQNLQQTVQKQNKTSQNKNTQSQSGKSAHSRQGNEVPSTKETDKQKPPQKAPETSNNPAISPQKSPNLPAANEPSEETTATSANQRSQERRTKTVSTATSSGVATPTLKKYPRLPFQVQLTSAVKAPGNLLTIANPNPADSIADSLLQGDSDPFQEDESQNWSWGAHLTPTYASYQYSNANSTGAQNISRSNTGGSEELISQKVMSRPETAEGPGKGIAIGINATYQWHDNLSLQAGLSYAYTRQDFNARKIKRVAVPIDTIDPSSVGNTIYDTIQRVKQVEATNTYHRLLLPVSVKYEISHFNRWTLQTKLGIKGSYLLSANGRFIAQTQKNGEQENVIGNFQGDQLRSFNMRYHLGLGVSYQLSPEWTLSAEPTFGQQLLPAYNDGFGVQRKANWFRLSLGVNKQF